MIPSLILLGAVSVPGESSVSPDTQTTRTAIIQ